MDKKTEAPPPSESQGFDATLKYLESEIKMDKKQGDNNKGKRGHYQQKECPYCHAMVGNLKNHVSLKHQAEAGEAPPLPAPQELTKDDLVTGSEPKAKKDNELKPPVYFCQDCKAELRKGESECWNCRAVLNWEGL